MDKLTALQVNEINEIIEQVAKALKPGAEIGARDRKILVNLLRSGKVAKKPVYFKTKREYSEAIITHFTKEKGVAKSRYSAAAQPDIFLIA